MATDVRVSNRVVRSTIHDWHATRIADARLSGLTCWPEISSTSLPIVM